MENPKAMDEYQIKHLDLGQEKKAILYNRVLTMAGHRSRSQIIFLLVAFANLVLSSNVTCIYMSKKHMSPSLLDF